MTNLEPIKAVAEVMGWRDLTLFTGLREGTVLVGIPPQGVGQSQVPNWPEDLPACMRDLWPWLRREFRFGGFSLSWIPGIAEFNGHLKPAHLGGERIYRRAETEASAICHAVLAVAEKRRSKAMTRPVSRPNNPYLPAPHLEISNATYELEKQARVFEEGVDAGRKWGREEKDTEWRETVRKLLDGVRFGGYGQFISVKDVEALL